MNSRAKILLLCGSLFLQFGSVAFAREASQPRATQVRQVRLAPHLGRLNADGSFGPLFDAIGADFDSRVTNLLIQSDGKMLILFHDSRAINPPEEPNRIGRFLPDGSPDTAFKLDSSIKLFSRYSSMHSMALQSDGKILLSGEFQFSEERRRYLVRLEPDGSLDPEFFRNALLNDRIKQIAFQPDGKILLVSEDILGNVRLDRLQPDGNPDTTFQPAPEVSRFNYNFEGKIAVQPDGKILAAGEFSINESPGSDGSILRLNPDGSLDSGFHPVRVEEGRREIRAMVVQKNGTILVGGSFGTLNGIKSAGLGLLAPDGTVDPLFAEAVGQNGFAAELNELLVQEDGKIVVGLNSSVYGSLARFHENGNLDQEFNKRIAGGLNGTVLCLAAQQDGKIIAGGEFESVLEPPAAFPQYNKCTGPGQCVAIPAILGSWDVVNVAFVDEMTRYYQRRNSEIDGVWIKVPKPKVICVDGVCKADDSGV